MKDIILSFIIIIGILSIMYLTLFFLLGLAILLKVVAGTATQSGTGTIFASMIENPSLLIVAGFFAILFIAYKIKHEKNKRRKL